MDKKIERLGQSTEWSFWDWLMGGGRSGAGSEG